MSLLQLLHETTLEGANVTSTPQWEQFTSSNNWKRHVRHTNSLAGSRRLQLSWAGSSGCLPLACTSLTMPLMTLLILVALELLRWWGGGS